MKWNWELPGWPNFTYDGEALAGMEAAFLKGSGELSGMLSHVGTEQQSHLRSDFLEDEAVQTSRIEGEVLDRASIQLSIRRNLGLKVADGVVEKSREKGIADLLADGESTFAEPLVSGQLYRWHEMLFQGQVTNEGKAQFRKDGDPMQVVSGPIHEPVVHFEAPPSQSVPIEMSAFLKWFNDTLPGDNRLPLPALARASLAQLHFLAIHPFHDGNGRIARVISQKALSQAVGTPLPISISKVIEKQKKEYYLALAQTNHSLEATEWLVYFGGVVLEAIQYSQEWVGFTIRKSKFYQKYSSLLNDRQAKVVARIFEEGPKGFEGGLSAGNYLSITKTSPATARRDLAGLVKMGAMVKSGEKKGTRYGLVVV